MPLYMIFFPEINDLSDNWKMIESEVFDVQTMSLLEIWWLLTFKQ